MNLLKLGGKVYVILMYDMDTKRVAKMLKLCRRYLNWIQNSVFEGEISVAALKQLEFEAKDIMDLEIDSLIVFKSRENRWLEKEVIGQEKSEITNIL